MAELVCAGPFATEGERRAAKALQQLPADWVVICNKVLPRGDHSYEIDFIVIGNRWVFLLDEKSWRGRILGNDQLWVRADGFSMRSPLAKADYIAKVLAGHIGWKVTPLKDGEHYVRGGVLLSESKQLPQIHDSRAGNGIFLLENVCERLQLIDRQGGNPLVGQLCSRVSHALFDLSNRPQVPTKIEALTIVDAVALRPGVRLFNATMDGSPDKLLHLMVYDLTKDPIDSKALYDFYMHECLALQKLNATLASDIVFESGDLYALKQYTSPSEVLQQAAAEFATMKSINSIYLPYAFDIYPPQNDVHVKMEYIPGPTLQQVEMEFPWPLERWWSFAQGLLNAVEALEEKQLLHRDIKPANIILHKADNRPVLIDFGFAIRQGVSGKAAGTPLFLPPETFSVSSSSAFPLSCDRYAAGVVLFKSLFGYMPFSITNGIQRHLIPLEQFIDAKMRRLAAVLLRAVSNDPAERPATAAQMRQELQTALLAVEEPVEAEALQEHINPWVNDVRSLYRNSDIGNKNNRGLDTAFVRETYVPTALDEYLLPAIFELKPKAVFLCGNPGDGKTAFLEKVQQRLSGTAGKNSAKR